MPAVSSATHIGVPTADGDGIIALADLLRRFEADIVIRLHEADFSLLPQTGPILTHFNLPHASNPVGSRCVLLPILRPGSPGRGAAEIVPVIDPARFRMATCLEVIDHCALANVTAEQFATSFPTIRTADALLAALVARYKDETEAEIVAGGCSVTRLLLDPAG